MSSTIDTDVIVVGGGPGGLAAAAHAAEAGARVLLVDRGPRPGGQIWRHRATPPRAARRWIRRVELSGVGTLFGTTVVDAPRPGALLLEHRGRPLEARYERLILATGARERFLPFPGWTPLPKF